MNERGRPDGSQYHSSNGTGAQTNTRAGESAPCETLAEDSRDLTREVHHVAEFLDLHQAVDVDRLGPAHAVDVVPCEIDEHDVLGAVLEGSEQLPCETIVL
jgi:hypothetical protein